MTSHTTPPQSAPSGPATGSGNTQGVIIRSGYLLTMDDQLGDLPTGDVLVEGTTIAQVAGRIDPPPGWHGEVIDATGMLVIPGLVDNHRHMWQSLIRGVSANLTFGEYFAHTLEVLSARFTPDDIYLGNLLSAYEAIDAGVTCVVDWSHALNSAEHAQAALQALEDSGARAVLAYGPPSTQWWKTDGLPEPADVTALHRHAQPDPLVSVALAIRGPEFCDEHRWRADLELARELGIRVTMHAGIPGFFDMAPSVRLLHRARLLGPDLTFVHCNAMTTDDFRIIAEAGAHVSVSPEVEIQKGFGMPPLSAILQAGARPTVSVDVVTAIGGDLLTQLRFLLQLQRLAGHQRAVEQTGQPMRELPLSTRDVLPYVTTHAAASLGLDHQIGTITPGKQADLVLIDTEDLNLLACEPTAALVQAAHPGNVHTVLVAGHVVKRHRKLVGVHLSGLRQEVHTANRRILHETSHHPTGS